MLDIVFYFRKPASSVKLNEDTLKSIKNKILNNLDSSSEEFKILKDMSVFKMVSIGQTKLSYEDNSPYMKLWKLLTNEINRYFQKQKSDISFECWSYINDKKLYDMLEEE